MPAVWLQHWRAPGSSPVVAPQKQCAAAPGNGNRGVRDHPTARSARTVMAVIISSALEPRPGHWLPSAWAGTAH